MDTTMIRCVIATLNDIEVKGKDNMDKLLGSIMALEGVAQMMEQPAPEEPKEVEADGR
jgi:predicted phage tail protein